MPGSQLKQLKASLHARRSAPAKRESSRGDAQGTHIKNNANGRNSIKHRVNDSKARADSLRRSTLLPALQNRHKVGGIVDRRIGENDPTMSPEERMLQRYSKQRSKRGDTFDLEEEEGEEGFLTHRGQSLFEGQLDDFADADVEVSDGEAELSSKKEKRKRQDETDGYQDIAESEQPERKKTKKEVMEEVIAKSKLYKYERQRAKEEDDDIRAELDKGVGDLLDVLRGVRRIPVPVEPLEVPKSNGMTIHPDRLAQMNGTAVPVETIEPEVGSQSRSKSPNPQPNVMLESSPQRPEARTLTAEQQYDKSIRQMARDQRAQPTERTKTEEEKATEEAERLRQLEAKRLARMRGEVDDSESGRNEKTGDEIDEDDEDDHNEATAFGLSDNTLKRREELDVEDEDDFIIDEDLVASGSEIDSDLSEEFESAAEEEDDDDEFLKDVLPDGAKSKEALASATNQIPYTYPCPDSHEGLLQIVKGVPVADLPLVVQRIRALYHPQLNPQNKDKLARFAATLVDHLSYLGLQKSPLPVVEALIRHIHSVSKSYPLATAERFRSKLGDMLKRKDLSSGDLYILTAIGTIYPTSDHFHQVVTPAITIMARWLSTKKAESTQDLNTGAYVVRLCIKYQQLSKRYVPEAILFTISALKSTSEAQLLRPHILNLLNMATLWQDKSAFYEMFYPNAYKALKSTGDKKAVQHLRIALHQSILARRPLELHHHRPLPIKTSIPRFEDDFNPNKHYDPDRERAEANKLKKEYKREKKGAVRELKKDAEFLRREKLKDKKERDAEYEKKQRRLIAEIQGEEGREKNEYEREKRRRKAKR